MAINTVLANNQAAEISVGADRLRTAESGLHAYGDALQANWQGREMAYIQEAIVHVRGQLQLSERELRDLSNDMRLAAEAIQREEAAAAVAEQARLEEQRRIAAAQTAYNEACDELDKLLKGRQSILEKIKKKPSLIQKYKKELAGFDEKIKAAEQKCADCKKALAEARG